MKKLNLALISLAVFGVSFANAASLECSSIKDATVTGVKFITLSPSIDNTTTETQLNEIMKQFEGPLMPVSAYNCEYKSGVSNKTFVKTHKVSNKLLSLNDVKSCENPEYDLGTVYIDVDGKKVRQPMQGDENAIQVGLLSYQPVNGITQHLMATASYSGNCTFTFTQQN
jgi:hypothetical protein